MTSGLETVQFYYRNLWSTIHACADRGNWQFERKSTEPIVCEDY